MLYLIKFDLIYNIGALDEIWRMAFPKFIGWNYGSPDDGFNEWFIFLNNQKPILLK